MDAVGAELVALYADPDELLKHAHVADVEEITDNEYNLNIPRYVDTFEPEPHVPVRQALKVLAAAEFAAQSAQDDLTKLLKAAGYAE